MTFTIGRVTLGDALSVPQLASTIRDVSLDGESLTVRGVVSKVDQAAASAAMQRIAGLDDPRDEPVVPLTWDDGPEDIPGFYRVMSASVDGEAGLATEGVVDFSVSLERVTGFAAPMFEDTLMGVARTGQSVASPQAFMGLPGTVKGYEIGASLTPTFSTRTSAQGDVTVFTDGSNTLFSKTARPTFYVPPEDWYDGAASLYVDGEVTVGREVRNLPTNWRISNGLVRYTGGASGITMERFYNGSWIDSRLLRPYRRIDSSTLNYLEAPHTVSVMRNSPEEVIVRLTYDAASAIPGARFSVMLDLSLRRGSRIAAFREFTRGSYRWGIAIESFGSSFTSLSPGVYASGVVLGPDDDAGIGIGTGSDGFTTTTARIQLVAAGIELIAGIGYYGSGPSGAGATGIDTAQAVLNQWAAAQVERIDAVMR